MWECYIVPRSFWARYHNDINRYSPKMKKLGGGGPFPISHAELLPEMEPFRKMLTRTWTSVGEKVSDNIYDGEMNGFTHGVDTINRRTHSKRLIIDRVNRTCKGIIVIDRSGNEMSFFARREIIVSQGVFETPKLLMLCGIGPKHHLDKHGIDTVIDSPHAGQNLLDHPGVPFVLRVKDGYGMDDHLLRKGPQHDATVSAFNRNQSGPTGSGLLEMVGFPRIDKYLERDPICRQAKAANRGVDLFCPEGQPHFELDFWTTHERRGRPGPPWSDPGEVTLNSADPLEQPNINLNFFANNLDIIARREGIRFSYDLLENLRVVDASVIPVIPDCRIQNSVYMVAEKGADLIKEGHNDIYQMRSGFQGARL
ncbi:Cyclase atC [Colletotrichum gloeosporioides]|uniref:Cyclase atC n=1 Tax=Colletotrichum gloeosporioides TaxID=474922 RepID=A0A8H4CP30_COLGL|nr:Cyclase atC [Colletotrichum gloeosporioides]KAF3807444.1 Cyclase atC [Colletotrichum gloeosporioides]